jgi:hypothetical protein
MMERVLNQGSRRRRSDIETRGVMIYFDLYIHWTFSFVLH